MFQISQNPPVDWIDVEKKLYNLGASNVYHIKADKCIEDLFLLDIDGIVKFLKIKKTKLIGNNGVERLENLFLKGNRIYQKGFTTKGFIASLNLSLILDKKHEMFEPLINELINNN